MRKMVTLSLGAAALLYVAALLSTPAPAASCGPICAGSCPGGKVRIHNTCSGQFTCGSFCIPE